jgi:hypothetical protein
MRKKVNKGEINMAFEIQKRFDMKFVDWGELGEDHDPETNLVVKEGYGVRGFVENVSEGEGGKLKGLILSNPLVVKKKGNDPAKYPKEADVDKNLYVKGNASLDRQVLNDDSDDFLPVKVGDEVIIIYTGKYPTKGGKEGYGMEVLVDRK